MELEFKRKWSDFIKIQIKTRWSLSNYKDCMQIFIIIVYLNTSLDYPCPDFFNGIVSLIVKLKRNQNKKYWH
jgi:hypothetical protein